MGSPEFALPSLKNLMNSNHAIIAVITSPDKPKGRGLKIVSTPVKIFADKKKIRIFQPLNLKDPALITELKQLHADLFVVVAFRILPEEILAIPPRGIINLHPSLLPKYRGAAPINWAIIKGEQETGITTFLIEQKVDAGQILLRKKVAIKEEETAGELSERLSEMGADILLETIDNFEKNEIIPQLQNEKEVTKAPKIKKEDCIVNWESSSVEIRNLIRGLCPIPGALTYYKNKILKLYKVDLYEDELTDTSPGRILNIDKKTGIFVETGRGGVIVKELMQEGKKRMNVTDFLKGHTISDGEYFGIR